MEKTSYDLLWMVLCASLVFFMQAGFLCLETGLTRSKNNINVALKNLADFCVSCLLYWLVGYGLMFGLSNGGWLGASHFALDFGTEPVWTSLFFLYQVMFCGTAVTILSGAVAERIRFDGYVILTVLVSAIIYPIFGHWVWNGIEIGDSLGWLSQLGFVDFAGSTVVHSVGGWVALATLIVIGLRSGRFANNETRAITGSNLTISALGVLIIWLGWIGFNGGSVLAFDNSVITVVLNTLLSGGAGLTVMLIISMIWLDRVPPDHLLNGVLAGLVGVTASAHAVTSLEAVVIGTVSGLVMWTVSELLIRYQIDDAVGAVPVHLGAGIWGTLAVALFGAPDILGTNLDWLNQLGIQSLGVVVCGVWAFGLTYLVISGINHFIKPLRVTQEAELIGLNVAEHGASTEILDLYQAMEDTARTGDPRARAPVEPFTEVGQIARRYNAVLAALEEATTRTEAIVRTAMDGILTFDQHALTILSVNPAALTMLGYTKDDLLDQLVTRLLKSGSSDIRRSGLRDLINALTQPTALGTAREVIGLRSDGTIFPMELTITESDTSEKQFFTATFRDITEAKAMREDLVTARDQAIAANQWKTELLGKVSHELRTPIGGILGYAEMIKEGVFGDVNADQKDGLNAIIDGSNYLTLIVRDLLDQAQLDAG